MPKHHKSLRLNNYGSYITQLCYSAERIEDSVNLLNKVFCNIHKEVQKIGHSLKSCLVPHFKNKCLFIQEYQIPIFELVVLYLIGPLRKDSSL